MDNLLLVVMQSAHLVTQRKAFHQSMEELLTLSREQTSSQPLIVSALEQLKVMQTKPKKQKIQMEYMHHTDGVYSRHFSQYKYAWKSRV